MQLPQVFVYGTVLGPNVDTPPELLVERSIVFGPANQSSLMEEDAQHRPFDAILAHTP